MKNCPSTNPHHAAEEVFSHRARLGRRVSVLLWAAVLLAMAFPVALAAQPNQIISNLDAGQLNTALQAGGTVTFAVDGTIRLTNTIALSNNVILDGTNHSISISGGGTVEIFNILPAGQVTLRHLTLANGVENSNYVPFPGSGQALTGQGTVVIEASTDLKQWTPIFTNPPGFGTMQFIDLSASNHWQRYYRAATPGNP